MKRRNFFTALGAAAAGLAGAKKASAKSAVEMWEPANKWFTYVAFQENGQYLAVVTYTITPSNEVTFEIQSKLPHLKNMTNRVYKYPDKYDPNNHFLLELHAEGIVGDLEECLG